MKFVIHPLLVIFFLIFTKLGYFYLLINYLITIILHEMAHAFVAKKLGYKLNQIKLMPYGASLSGKSCYFRAKDEVIIAIAGPLFNLIVAFVLCAVWWIEPITYVYTIDFFKSNLVVALTNFFPIFPLDGGRVLSGLLSVKYSRTVVSKRIKIIGICCSVLILVGFVITTFYIPNYTFLAFGSFLFISSILDDKSTVYSTISFLDKKIGLSSGLLIREIAIPENLPLYKLFSKIKQDTITNFCVVNSNYQVIGKITECQLDNLIRIYPVHIQVGKIIGE